MVLVSVLYPNTAGSRFDQDYYLATHIPLVRRLWEGMGLRDVRLLRGVGTGDGGPALYQVIELLSFESGEALQRAVTSHGGEIFADIPRFTDVQPVVQVNETLG